jgi:hypothetical protein
MVELALGKPEKSVILLKMAQRRTKKLVILKIVKLALGQAEK